MDTNKNNNKMPRICIIGAGFSGLCMAINLKTKLNLESFTIYEACSEVGGTWLVNTYPGCACDVPSHLYSFSFSPKYDWSSTFSPQPEILEYTKGVTKKFGIYPHIRFHTKVQCLQWDDREYKWHATVLNTRTNKVENEDFDIVINGTGKIRIPHYPAEYLNFQGPLLHSAEWDPSVDLSGKRVGVVGTGASAVQIINALAPQVGHLSIFQRKAPFIIPRIQFQYSETAKWAFSAIPGLYHLSRASMFLLHELIYGATRHESYFNKFGTKLARWYRNSQIKDPVLREKATPDYAFACKRIVLSESYYSTLVRNNVELVTAKIEAVEGTSLKTKDGKNHDLDVLVLATGYQPHDFFSPMKVYGRDGVDVLQEWKKERPRGYMGILSWQMPNFFTLLGPYTAVGHSSNMFNIECQVDWCIEVIKKMMDEEASSISIRREVEDEFMKFVDDTMKETVWGNEQCGSWYLDSKGVNTTLWPSSQVEFWRRCGIVEANMFEFNKAKIYLN